MEQKEYILSMLNERKRSITMQSMKYNGEKYEPHEQEIINDIHEAMIVEARRVGECIEFMEGLD